MEHHGSANRQLLKPADQKTAAMFDLLNEAHLSASDVGHTAMPIFGLTVASGGAKIMREMPIEECEELADWIEGLDTSAAIPIPGAAYAPFACGKSYWQATVLPLLKRRIERPNPRPYSGPGDIFAAVKSAVQLEDFAAKFTELEAAGKDRMRGRCPLHSENSPSFVIYRETQTWRCFGACAIGGDIIALTQKLKDKGRI